MEIRKKNLPLLKYVFLFFIFLSWKQINVIWFINKWFGAKILKSIKSWNKKTPISDWRIAIAYDFLIIKMLDCCHKKQSNYTKRVSLENETNMIIIIMIYILILFQVPPPPDAGAFKPRVPKATSFRRFYERGDFPIALEFDTKGNKIAWKVIYILCFLFAFASTLGHYNLFCPWLHIFRCNNAYACRWPSLDRKKIHIHHITSNI